MNKIKLTCFGGVSTVTGANFFLEIGDKKILVDCGMVQGGLDAGEKNRKPFAYDPTTIDILFITHAHIDHTGLVPKLVKVGFRGEIYSTPETKEIAALLLIDSSKINSNDDKPLYGPEDVGRTMALWQTFPYHEQRKFGQFSMEFLDSGHILGSAMVKFNLPDGHTMLFSGDLGNTSSPLLKDTEKVSDIDYLLMESVYGDRNHEDKLVRRQKLESVIKEIIKNSGTLLIPTFALERAQILLHELDDLFENGALSPVPVFLDSPLAIRITEIYEKRERQFNESVNRELDAGDQIFSFANLKLTAEIRDSQEILKVPGPKIILAGSGMSTAGRIVGHESIYLPDPKTIILFVGYQAPGTLGREILEGVKTVKIDGKEISVKAKIEKIDGYSAHADSDTLFKFVEGSKKSLKKVFVTMGEPKSSIFLAQRLRDELDVNAFVPEVGKEYLLD